MGRSGRASAADQLPSLKRVALAGLQAEWSAADGRGHFGLGREVQRCVRGKANASKVKSPPDGTTQCARSAIALPQGELRRRPEHLRPTAGLELGFDRWGRAITVYFFTAALPQGMQPIGS